MRADPEVWRFADNGFMGENRNPSRELANLIAALEPELLPGKFVFVSITDEQGRDPRVLASVREPEGLSAVLTQDAADELGLEYGFVAAWITLRVESALDAVGLTAAVSTSLTEAGISCNVIAGLHHDHLLVPAEEAERAIGTLKALSQAPPAPSLHNLHYHA